MNSRNYKDRVLTKGQLNILSIVLLLFSAVIFGLGILFFVTCNDGTTFWFVMKIILGVIFVLLGGFGVVISLIMLITSLAMKVDRGSVKEGNIAKVGTVNMIKCDRCGRQLEREDDVCAECGFDNSQRKK